MLSRPSRPRRKRCSTPPTRIPSCPRPSRSTTRHDNTRTGTRRRGRGHHRREHWDADTARPGTELTVTNPTYDFTHQLALVTGAGSGIGLPAATAVPAAGAAVALAAHARHAAPPTPHHL